MNCREFIIEFEERNALTETAVLHLKICADCQKTSREQTRVWQMIDGLQRVDAPKNFDFLVKARIANSKPASSQSRFLPVLRYVLPVSVILLISLVIFNTSYFSSNNTALQVDATVPQVLNEKDVSLINSFSTNQAVVAANSDNEILTTKPSNVNLGSLANNQEKQFVVARSKTKPRTNTLKKDLNDDGAGSRDLSLTPPPPVKLPLGINPNKIIESLPNTGNLKSFTAGEILSFLGIESVSENGKLQVKAVKKDSSAERSGVEIGDVIEAIDGKKISSEPFSSKIIEGKTLTVTRDAKKIQINLQN